MIDREFLNARYWHLENRLRAIEASIREYGDSMPEMHRDYKIKQMIPSVISAMKKIRFCPNDYGICQDCGEEIAKGRLMIIPEAECCTKCQKKRKSEAAYVF
ncbi:MAG TPA: TraR/DksA C4-type zinc finger protein [Candidatus Moranbacteria bacterium]|jgi:RNA polymerase-binding transcription factor DksA|nr:TraR/DksA family transcriptional regulator [Candidatus Moranbacteria bacterium]HOF42496.1 TraR/DksA C4-type zinc finger protein [Candidatus Moranbacteria bacterium]HPX94602.1 TraR/DksA C4-type zinc finger protein [Candidatus Moranbacteria bacterium]HQB59805.1 TraR/DksA C4-type zinc finger protein [Candidatus Moranbacteria bacterium]